MAFELVRWIQAWEGCGWEAHWPFIEQYPVKPERNDELFPNCTIVGYQEQKGVLDAIEYKHLIVWMRIRSRKKRPYLRSHSCPGNRVEPRSCISNCKSMLPPCSYFLLYSPPFSWKEKPIVRNHSVETDFYFLFLILDYNFKKKVKNACILITPARKIGQKSKTK